MSGYQFTDAQLDVLAQLNLTLRAADLETLFTAEAQQPQTLGTLVRVANALYRAGHPVIDDQQYDQYLQQLQAIDPADPFLAAVEPEVVSDSKTVPLPQKMLSTDKAYSLQEIEKWTLRIAKAAAEIAVEIDAIELKITPKLDGYAAYDDGEILYTRGDGSRGQDITRAFSRGLKIANDAGRGLGAGEIVIKKSYFNQVLSEKFENSRNIQAAIIAEKKVAAEVQQAIDDRACVFYPFCELQHWTGSIKELLADFDNIVSKMWTVVDFDIDGLIIETTHPAIKRHMGATRKFHRWQIAFKVNHESAQVKVLDVVPQTSRTGRISPVAELVPTKLSGATLSRATVHHYNMVRTQGVGPGAVIKLVRSGLVIPKIEQVVIPAEPVLPDSCPSCCADLLWEGDHLICPNKSDCPAQTENTLIHFFKTLGNVDGFGPKVIEKITKFGIKHIHQIYAIAQTTLVELGFGDKTSHNLVEQLRASREIAIEDWRFLAAFGVSRLGAGNCEKLLQHYSIVELFEVGVEDVVKVDGFAQASAEAIVTGLASVKEEFFKVYQLGFTLDATPKAAATNNADSAIAGAVVVFTGAMQQGVRSDMEKRAKALGAKVAKSVTGKTTYLVTGEKVGETKIAAARDKGVTVLSEQDYLLLIDDAG